MIGHEQVSETKWLKCENCGGISSSLAEIDQDGFTESRHCCDSCVTQIGLRGQIKDYMTGEVLSRAEFMARCGSCLECGTIDSMETVQRGGVTLWVCSNCGVQNVVPGN